MSREHNPSAFPLAGYDENFPDPKQDGMTLRDYFIAHAPPVPEWFKPKMPPIPDISGCSEWARNKGYPWHKIKDEYGLIFIEILKPEDQKEALEINERVENARKELYRWKEDERREIYLQWPGFWADEQLKRRLS